MWLHSVSMGASGINSLQQHLRGSRQPSSPFCLRYESPQSRQQKISAQSGIVEAFQLIKKEVMFDNMPPEPL